MGNCRVRQIVSVDRLDSENDFVARRGTIPNSFLGRSETIGEFLGVDNLDFI
jgi:hypothetical protein